MLRSQPMLRIISRSRFPNPQSSLKAITISRPPHTRCLHPTPHQRNTPSWPSPPVPQPKVGPSDDLTSGTPGKDLQSSRPNVHHESFWWEWTHSPSFQAALTTIVGLGMVFASGVGYLEWYKHHVLHRMSRAFDAGYDPALELSTIHAPQSAHIHRREQALMDRIVRGEEAGGYYLVIGPKGTGKGTMILDAMRAVKAEGASVCEAHPDLEVFRLRLGKALDFDFYEDWQGSLFSRADPRQGGAALDVERAMTKLEKVALRYARANGRPLVMAFNNIHLFPNNEEGHAVLYQLQQRAEAWAEAGILTMVFTTDDYWCLDKMKKNASRMRILSVYDLSAAESISALRHLRRHALSLRHGKEVVVEGDDILRRVYELVGGRTSFLARVARASDMVEEAQSMVEMEKGWMLSKIGLIPEMDDDVIWASCSWLLLRHLAQHAPPLSSSSFDIAEATNEEPEIDISPMPIEVSEDDAGDILVRTAAPTASGTLALLESDVELPHVTYDEARRIMTRTDFLDGLDHANIVSIDVHHNVRADSMLILRAAQDVVAVSGFDSMLDQTRDRVDEIEGLHRQSELTVKEPFRLMFGRGPGGPTIDVVGLGGSFVAAEDVDEEGDDEEPVDKGVEKEDRRLV